MTRGHFGERVSLRSFRIDVTGHLVDRSVAEELAYWPEVDLVTCRFMPASGAAGRVVAWPVGRILEMLLEMDGAP